MPLPPDALDRARRQADLSHSELWWRCFELGGMSSAAELEAYLCGALEPTPHERDVVVAALYERFAELGGDCPVPYAGDD